MSTWSYADKLRSLADWLDAHPAWADEFAGEWDYPSIHAYVLSNEEGIVPERMQRLVRALGNAVKNGGSGVVWADHEEKVNEEIIWRANVSLTGACQKVPKVDPETGEPVMRREIRYMETGDLVQDYDYVCPESFLR